MKEDYYSKRIIRELFFFFFLYCLGLLCKTTPCTTVQDYALYYWQNYDMPLTIVKYYDSP